MVIFVDNGQSIISVGEFAIRTISELVACSVHLGLDTFKINFGSNISELE